MAHGSDPWQRAQNGTNILATNIRFPVPDIEKPSGAVGDSALTTLLHPSCTAYPTHKVDVGGRVIPFGPT
jgi:hypothetical protein